MKADRIIDWLSGLILLVAATGVYVCVREGNFAAVFAWCMVAGVDFLLIVQGFLVDQMRHRLMDRDVQVRHYQSELYPMPDRPDLQPRDRQGRVVPFESDADRPMPPWLKRGGAG